MTETVENTITVAGDFDLVRKSFYIDKVWKPALQVHEDIGSCARWLDALTMLYDYDGRLYFSNGKPYRHEEITDIFDDHDNRWMGLFLEADASGVRPKRFSRKLERLRLIELYTRLLHATDTHVAA